MRRLLFTIIIAAVSSLGLFAQISDLSGYKIFVNPGHGGYDESNDRHIVATDFWESEGNLVKGLFLRQLLQNMNATVYMSRTTNTSADDLDLSEIDAMANGYNVDFFLAIHSNGYNGTSNRPLMLFRGYDDAPVFAGAKTMAQIMWQKIYEKGNCWTSSSMYVKGDWTFYPDWGTQGLGALRTLTMPGVLSEGSFHDYISESWRLRNSDYCHHESWAFLRSFMQYYNVQSLSHGIIAGVVRDPDNSPEWYYKSGTLDQNLPINNVSVTLMPGGQSFQVDDLNNGFYLFDSIPPGEYKVYFDGLEDFYPDSLTVEVTANTSTLADIYLKYDTTRVPGLVSLSPDLADSIAFDQEFTLLFSIPMNPDSVQKALTFEPQTEMTYSWDEKYKTLVVRPTICFTGKTQYSLKLSVTACSEWKVSIASDLEYSFVTKARSGLSLERSFPTTGKTGVTLYPQIRLYFDAPLNESSAQTEIVLKDDAGQTITKKNEQFVNNDNGKGYFFEASQALELNKVYHVVLGAGLTDAVGMTLGEAVDISFTTRDKAYTSGAVIESFETISNFWDPNTSGSTTGTDAALTTFTSSSDVKYSGSYSGKLNYVFTEASDGVCRVFNTTKPSIGSDESKKFSIWVFGDLSNNWLEYWFYTSGSTNQIVTVRKVDWAGWDQITIPLSDIGGTGERLFHSIVILQTTDGAKSGTMWFDEASLYSLTAREDINEDNDEMVLYPNPLNGEGTISFGLDERSNVALVVYSVDGRKMQEKNYGIIEPGTQVLKWNPGSALLPGVYILRLEMRPVSGGPVTFSTTRCLLTR